MKLHYTKILLFFFPLYILVASYHVYSKNKPSITSHHTQTNRSLCECDTQSSNYDKDTGMKSVMQQFVDRTSQRFEEYQERMKEKRQKRKEERDKNVQEIILKDKIEKSLLEKVEKGCLKCGCGLGVVATGVGIIGPVAVKVWTNAAVVAAAEKGIEEGIKVAIEKLGNIVGLSQFNVFDWTAIVTPTTYYKPMKLVFMVTEAYNKCTDVEAAKETLFCSATEAWRQQYSTLPLETITREAAKAARAAGEAAGMKAGKIAVIESLKKLYVDYFWPEMSNYILNMSHYNDVVNLTAVIHEPKFNVCKDAGEVILDKCNAFDMGFGILKKDGFTNGLLPGEAVPKVLENVAAKAELTAKAAEAAESAKVTAAITEKQTA
ncbi:hypothetical protein PFBG_06071, partial [Plasmodium falciparum 7G8]